MSSKKKIASIYRQKGRKRREEPFRNRLYSFSRLARNFGSENGMA